MITSETEQRSKEWHEIKKGIPGASQFDKIVTTKGEPSKQAQKLMYQLAAERVSGISEEGYKSQWMERGIELESQAIEFYQLVTDATVTKVGFCFSDERKIYGCSPDGLVGDDGGLEIKCPSASVHVEYLLSGVLPTEYFQQVQGSLLVTGRKYWDFLSYYPGLKPLIVRVYRDEAFITKLQSALETFCNELEKIVEKIK